MRHLHLIALLALGLLSTLVTAEIYYMTNCEHHIHRPSDLLPRSPSQNLTTNKNGVTYSSRIYYYKDIGRSHDWRNAPDAKSVAFRLPQFSPGYILWEAWDDLPGQPHQGMVVAFMHGNVVSAWVRSDARSKADYEWIGKLTETSGQVLLASYQCYKDNYRVLNNWGIISQSEICYSLYYCVR
ncbi:hypothetical protein HDU67_004943 [Dinochytrium kinnereticum]|nr:hypothetical protein HDU67_004943 [Dinochytrium kinnereticum]